VIAEAKRGVESKDPRYQLYGQLLATESAAWGSNPMLIQNIFAKWCYFREMPRASESARHQRRQCLAL